MKLFFTIASFLFFITIGFSQTKGTAKLIGYKQPVVGGASPKGIIDEQGNETTVKRRSVNNYFIYIISPSRIYPIEMWINGEVFSINTQIVKSTPVVMLNEIIPSKPKEIILVPKTSEKVIQLVPAPAIEGKSIFKSKSLASANELVVVYRLNGKNYYQTLGKLKQLEPAILP